MFDCMKACIHHYLSYIIFMMLLSYFSRDIYYLILSSTLLSSYDSPCLLYCFLVLKFFNKRCDHTRVNWSLMWTLTLCFCTFECGSQTPLRLEWSTLPTGTSGTHPGPKDVGLVDAPTELVVPYPLPPAVARSRLVLFIWFYLVCISNSFILCLSWLCRLSEH